MEYLLMVSIAKQTIILAHKVVVSEDLTGQTTQHTCTSSSINEENSQIPKDHADFLMCVMGYFVVQSIIFVFGVRTKYKRRFYISMFN